ncbi:MAG: hypothetical protein RR854_00280 [Muribaculaceae bacterium]
MGEIADSIINGDLDYITGEYIGEGYGYPRTYHKNKSKVRKPKKLVKKLERVQIKNDEELSFEEIIQSNKDVLKRIKEKGDK